MYFGQLVLGKARNAYDCADCKEPIQATTLYASLISKSKGETGKRWATRIHYDCLISYLNKSFSIRQEAILRRRGESRPRLDITPEARHQRRRLLQYIHRDKTNLYMAYSTENSRGIQQAYKSLGLHLGSLSENPDLGETAKFYFDDKRLGDVIKKHFLADPKIAPELKAAYVQAEGDYAGVSEALASISAEYKSSGQLKPRNTPDDAEDREEAS